MIWGCRPRGLPTSRDATRRRGLTKTAESVETMSEMTDPVKEDLPDAGAEQGQADASVTEGAEVAAEESEVESSGEIQEESATEEPEADEADAQPVSEVVETDDDQQLQWYILKVQSNRENSIAESLQRRVAVAGLDDQFGQIIVPAEMITEFKGGKKRIVKRKLWPGYIVVQMVINDDTWFLVRETPGIGDFTGAAGKPTPMEAREVDRILSKEEDKEEEAPRLKISFAVGDRVKINEGTFENFEGEVNTIDQASGRVTVMINIFGRSTPVELEYWQVETL